MLREVGLAFGLEITDRRVYLQLHQRHLCPQICGTGHHPAHGVYEDGDLCETFVGLILCAARHVDQHDVDVRARQTESNCIGAEEHRLSHGEDVLYENPDTLETKDLALVEIVSLNAKTVDEASHLFVHQCTEDFVLESLGIIVFLLVLFLSASPFLCINTPHGNAFFLHRVTSTTTTVGIECSWFYWTNQLILFTAC